MNKQWLFGKSWEEKKKITRQNFKDSQISRKKHVDSQKFEFTTKLCELLYVHRFCLIFHKHQWLIERVTYCKFIHNTRYFKASESQPWCYGLTRFVHAKLKLLGKLNKISEKSKREILLCLSTHGTRIYQLRIQTISLANLNLSDQKKMFWNYFFY